MDINTMTVTELESLAYQQIVLLERTQNNLKLINAEIEKRAVANVEEQGLDKPELNNDNKDGSGHSGTKK